MSNAKGREPVPVGCFSVKTCHFIEINLLFIQAEHDFLSRLLIVYSLPCYHILAYDLKLR